jgi:L-alanine-DL-glutamate epimerase-like enolase superfamily enzyme
MINYDSRGGDIVTAAISHLAHSTPPSLLFCRWNWLQSQNYQICHRSRNFTVEYCWCSTDFNSYGPKEIAVTTAKRKDGRMSAPTAPGLGVEVIESVLGEPLFDTKM